jgi:hypothetical protein
MAAMSLVAAKGGIKAAWQAQRKYRAAIENNNISGGMASNK